ncbi:cupin domain-containing protein [bacterium]|nr:cupin domain-containing protein [bacterium]
MKSLKINKNNEILIITESGKDNGGTLTLFEGKDDPGIGPPEHIHFLQEEKIVLLKGEMRAKTPEGEFDLEIGKEYFFEAGQPHVFWNTGTEQNHYSGHLKPACNWEYIIEHVYASANEAKDVKPGPFDAAYLLTKYKSEIDLLVIPKPVKKIVFPILYAIGSITGKYKKYKNAPKAFRA